MYIQSTYVKRLHMKYIILATLLCFNCFAFLGYGKKLDESKVFTMYREGSIDKTTRLHVATFDADDGSNSEKRNKTLCNLFAKLRNETNQAFSSRFWCEKGYFKE